MSFRYSGQGWRVADAIRTFGDQIMDLRGYRLSHTVDGTLGDADHSSRVSDHNPDENGIVRALDFYEWEPGIADSIGEALRESRDNRIKYFIHAERIFASYETSHRPAWEWGPYGGPNPHDTHAHLSTTRLGDNDPTPFQLVQEDNMLPINAQSGKEDIRLIQERLNTAYDAGLSVSGVWDTPTKNKVAVLLGSTTGDPKGKSGEHVNGRMYSHLTEALIRRIAGDGSGLSRQQVIDIINDAQIVAG